MLPKRVDRIGRRNSNRVRYCGSTHPGVVAVGQQEGVVVVVALAVEAMVEALDSEASTVATCTAGNRCIVRIESTSPARTVHDLHTRNRIAHPFVSERVKYNCTAMRRARPRPRHQ